MPQPFTVEVKVTVGAGMVPGYKKAAVRKALDKAADEALKKFKKTTATWNHQPVFEKQVKNDSALVGTDDEIYGFVNDGVPRRRIVPRPGSRHGKIIYQTDFTPKTTPRWIGSRRGGKKGPYDFIGPYSDWTGIEARKFDEVIQDEMEKEFEKLFEKAMEEQLFSHLANVFSVVGGTVRSGITRFTAP